MDHAGLAVDLDAGVGFVALGVAIGGEQCRLDGVDDDVDGDALVGLDGVQCRHVDIHAPASFPDWPASSSSTLVRGENSTWTTALAIPSERQFANRVVRPAPSGTTDRRAVVDFAESAGQLEPSDSVSSTLRPRARR